MTAPRRATFARKLGRDASATTPRELTVLVEGGWRERRTAAWLIAAAGRTEFREGIGELLLASEVCYAGTACCVASAAFGTPADTGLTAAYLNRHLRRPEWSAAPPTARTSPSTASRTPHRPPAVCAGGSPHPRRHGGEYGTPLPRPRAAYRCRCPAWTG
ncbi:DUF6000 family protein [Streptomyces sp. NPDC086838]|uniref:DUF6000 family protein n=1 Tax=Streptomyces sp. NPDC086838 TaxID=3365762 RepID=UPI003805F4E7